MTTPSTPDLVRETRMSRKLMDVLIRAGLVLALTLLCFRIFSPFISMMAWALILAVTMYPGHQALARRLGGKQGLAATLLVLVGITLVVAPTAVVLSSLGDSVYETIVNLRDDDLKVPPPPPGVAEWPVVGKKVSGAWSLAEKDLPSVVKRLQPQLTELATKALEMVASMAGSVLLFVFSFIIAGIIMAFGEAGSESARSILGRVAGTRRGVEFADLSTQTIRAVALGVVGVAFIQAMVMGIVMIIAAIPFAGVLAIIVLVLGIAQVPALLVSLPVIAYIWLSGNFETVPAVIYSVLLVVSGMLDNVLKPLLLGRGVDAPMPIVLIGALGGLAGAGILGMFVGATALSLGYQILMRWVNTDPDVVEIESELPNVS
ncbi:AI-2E family transporter [Variovorax sp. J22P240]|uniref:AI-2E family transporter n=1 Tax=Variovorax sp. J22P240 TaxID=3053514 RepID=UPI0025754D0D|nr:AI-2E family transporter [Variovorax sp. J22P240]MDM0000665.1 AI-2E family transporter [Variovorax sp. J22P240]